MKFLSPKVALHLYKSTIYPCMEYCCHGWDCVRSCYLELLDKLKKWICRTAGPSLAASLEPLAHRRNVASLSLFYRYYFGRCSLELAELVPLPFSRGRSTYYSDRLHDFSVTIPKCYKDVYINSFFPRTAWLWNSVLIECFPFSIILVALSLKLTDIFWPRLCNTGLVSSIASLTSWGEGTSLALVGHPASDGVTIKMIYGVDILHRPASHPIFSNWVG